MEEMIRKDGDTLELRVGICVVIVALLVGISPFLAKAYLLSTIPPLPPGPNLMHYYGQSSTTEFLRTQMDDLLQRALSDGGQLAEHCPQSKARLIDYRHSITVLKQLHLKFEQSIQATEREGCQPYKVLWTNIEVRESVMRRAQKLHALMMAGLTTVAALFLLVVLRSKRIPGWAKGFSMMAAGAVIAGWFPL
jgi:hypothetical protein